MALSDADITNFQALYKSEFGIEISKEDAHEKGIKLLSLMSAVYKPIPKGNQIKDSEQGSALPQTSN